MVKAFGEYLSLVQGNGLISGFVGIAWMDGTPFPMSTLSIQAGRSGGPNVKLKGLLETWRWDILPRNLFYDLTATEHSC